jgi:hypothetical protein
MQDPPRERYSSPSSLFVAWAGADEGSFVGAGFVGGGEEVVGAGEEVV